MAGVRYFVVVGELIDGGMRVLAVEKLDRPEQGSGVYRRRMLEYRDNWQARHNAPFFTAPRAFGYEVWDQTSPGLIHPVDAGSDIVVFSGGRVYSNGRRSMYLALDQPGKIALTNRVRSVIRHGYFGDTFLDAPSAVHTPGPASNEFD